MLAAHRVPAGLWAMARSRIAIAAANETRCWTRTSVKVRINADVHLAKFDTQRSCGRSFQQQQVRFIATQAGTIGAPLSKQDLQELVNRKKREDKNDGKDGKDREREEKGDEKYRRTILIDVREPHELLSHGSIETAVNVPLGELPEALMMGRFGQPGKESSPDFVMTCRSGKRSMTACEIAMQLGFDARNYSGGILEWHNLDPNKY